MNRSWGADPPAARAPLPFSAPVAPPPRPLRAVPEPASLSAAPAALTSAPVLPTCVSAPSVTADPRHHQLADELAPMVELWERLLAEHRPDRNGRCRTCTQGGTGLPGTPWPCALHGIAELAQRRHGHARGA